MDIREGWIKIESKISHIYMIICKDCKQSLTVTQIGPELDSHEIQFIIEKMHMNNQLDNLTQYIPGEYKKLNVELKNNSLCIYEPKLAISI